MVDNRECRASASRKNGKRSWAITRKALVICGLLLYLGSYVVISRIGFRRADIANVEGFYFIDPLTPGLETANRCCRVIYAPLTLIDQALGTGRPVGSDVIHHLD